MDKMGQIEKKFIFDGNDECLDFINTEIIERGKRIDMLGNFENLAVWLGEMGYIDPGTAEGMLALSNNEGGEILEKVRNFRRRLRDMAQVISEGGFLQSTHIEPINEILSQDACYSKLILLNGEAKLITHATTSKVDVLVPVAQAAAELLTSKDLSLVRKCMNSNCTLFFYDESKNHRRRWCSMGRCGNRMKAAIHYKRKKGRAVISS